MPTTQKATDPLAVVKRLYQSFESHDVSGALECFAHDIEINQSEELPWGGSHRGIEGAATFFSVLTSHIATKVTVDRFTVAGDSVVETGRTAGSAVATGRGFSIPETHVFKVRDGKIVRMDAYVDNEAMLAAISP